MQIVVTSKGFFSMKKLLSTVTSTVLLAATAIAEGEGTSNMPTVSDVEGVFSSFDETLGQLLDKAIPVVTAVIGGGLVIWGAIALVGVLKRAFTVGKGR